MHVHHETGAGMALKASDFETMPLCPTHHQFGGYGFAILAGQKRWENLYGNQDQHIEATRKLIEEKSL